VRRDDSNSNAIQDESRRIRRLRLLVDLTTSVLYQDPDLTLERAFQLVAATEAAAVSLFPDGRETFELLIKPRFARIIDERWPGEPGREN
jgi:hypothetical protein